MSADFEPVWTNRRWLACAALLWAGCTAVYFLTAPGRIDMYDGGIRYDVAQSLVERGEPVVQHPWYFAVNGVDGKRYAFYQLGATLTAVPFVLLGDWLGGGALEAKQFAYSLTTIPFAAGVVSLLFLIYGRLGCPMRRALLWAVVAAFCTLLWPYAGSTFDAVLQAFWLTLAVWAAVEALGARSYAWAIVSAVAFAILVNIQEMYVVLGACVLAAAPFRYRTVWERARSPIVLIIGLGLLAGIAAVFAYNTVRFGNPIDTGRTAVPHPLVGNPLVGLAGLALSPAKSVFLYSPPLLLALAGLRRLLRIAAPRVAPLVACLVIHVALIATLKFWAGEWAWGPRYTVASLPLALVGLPFAWEPPGRRALMWTACVAGLVAQLLGIAVDHQRYYFERALGAYFWVDESRMYTDSPLLARPSEVAAVFDDRARTEVRALVPGPLPLSMTSPIFGPAFGLAPHSAEWMRRYLVFYAPRPWTWWSRWLPEHQRPGPTGLLTVAGALVAVAAFAALGAVTGAERRTDD
jgi:hypothetical protein